MAHINSFRQVSFAQTCLGGICSVQHAIRVIVRGNNELTVIYFMCADIKVRLFTWYAPINRLNTLNVESLKINCSLDVRSCVCIRSFVILLIRCYSIVRTCIHTHTHTSKPLHNRCDRVIGKQPFRLTDNSYNQNNDIKRREHKPL